MTYPTTPSPNGAKKPDAPTSPTSGLKLLVHASSAGRGLFGGIFGTLTERVAACHTGSASTGTGGGYIPKSSLRLPPAPMDDLDERTGALLDNRLAEQAEKRSRLISQTAELNQQG